VVTRFDTHWEEDTRRNSGLLPFFYYCADRCQPSEAVCGLVLCGLSLCAVCAYRRVSYQYVRYHSCYSHVPVLQYSYCMQFHSSLSLYQCTLLPICTVPQLLQPCAGTAVQLLYAIPILTVTIYDMVYIQYLTAVGLTPGGSSTSHIRLTPGGSSTSHIYTQTVRIIQR
jgi:hypothetical protein